ncbi:MAG: hypothetical protein JNK26_05055 [Candidatus Doudnabacteria bacterium]|nr:hypothetical protein [Candidatus Doudnabacteria bacterium]
MKVFFGTTTREIIKFKDYYFAIRKELMEAGCVILDDWLPRAYEKKLKDSKGTRNMKRNYQDIVEAIDRADFVVIEYTVPNFSSSHQIIHANMRRKPVLVLRLEKDNSFKDTYLESIDSEFITVKEYTLATVEQTIKEFLGEVEIGYGLKRYNLMLERKHKYFLDWAKEEYNLSGSETVRKALDFMMSSDENYKKVLSAKP